MKNYNSKTILKASSNLWSSKIYLDKGTSEFQPSSVMITTIDVNNDASNVIPGEVKAKFNIRFFVRCNSKKTEIT